MTPLQHQIDWPNVDREVNAHGCARMPRILSPAECHRISGLYDQVEHFRSTIDMARYRFGSGQYRYFKTRTVLKAHSASCL